MKRSKLIHLLAAVLVVFVAISGCEPPPPAAEHDLEVLIRDAAALAVEHAGEAKAAEQLARGLSDGNELRALMSRAEEAAVQARKSADEAAALQSRIDDLAARGRVADEVVRAQQAAEEAAAQRAAINRLLLAFQEQTIRSSMGEATSRIVQHITIREDANREQVIEALNEIVADSFCDLLVDTVATGELPSQSDAWDAVVKNAQNSAMDFSGIYDIVSKDLIDVYSQLASGKKADELKAYKDACASVLIER